MKVLVVDDELPIRNWIAAVLKKITAVPLSVCEPAANGEEALKIVREEHPDVVLADITMPVMDGLTLLRHIKEVNRQTDVIILTCHDEFSYAKEAISEKAYDYILKTEITPKKLSNLLLKIKKEREERVSPDSWMDIQANQEAALKYLIRNAADIDNEQIGQALKKGDIHLQEKAIFAIAFRKEGYLSNRMMTESTSTQDDCVVNLVYYSYDNEMNVAIGNIVDIPSLLFQKNAQFEFARKLSKRFQSQVGVSDLYYSYRKIPDMILQSVRALSLDFYDELNIYQGNDGYSFAECAGYLESEKGKVLEAVNGNRCGELRNSVCNILKYLKKNPVYDIRELKQFFNSLTSGILLKIYAQQSRQFADRMRFYQEAVSEASLLSEVEQLLERLIEEFESKIHYEKSFYTQHIFRAIEYMEKNYVSCNVTEVADYVGLNPDYFSRLIKKETGQTFSQYLTNIKMERAISLLRNSDMKMYEIAEKVGYSDLAYFSRIFKKKFHMAPFEFRNKVLGENMKYLDASNNTTIKKQSE